MHWENVRNFILVWQGQDLSKKFLRNDKNILRQISEKIQNDEHVLNFPTPF